MGGYKKVLYRFLTWIHGRHTEGEGILHYNPRLTHFVFANDSKIKLDGELNIGANSYGNNGRSNILRLDRNGIINVSGNFKFMYGADVIVFEDAVLDLGNDSFVNSDCKIRCHKNIRIGNDCKISHNFIIMDSDAHQLEGDMHTKAVEIGNHVWIGTRVTVLSGSKLGDGCIVAAGALVKGEFPPHSLIGGVPAKIIRTDVEWSK